MLGNFIQACPAGTGTSLLAFALIVVSPYLADISWKLPKSSTFSIFTEIQFLPFLMAISKTSSSVIRQKISEVLNNFFDDDIQPCPNCIGSTVRTETCLTIQRTWAETGGNVSLVARWLGISRNTVYKHVKS